MRLRILTSYVLSLLSLGIAVGAFVGRWANSHQLAGWHNGDYVDMASNTSVCIIFLSLSILSVISLVIYVRRQCRDGEK